MREYKGISGRQPGESGIVTVPPQGLYRPEPYARSQSIENYMEMPDIDTSRPRESHILSRREDCKSEEVSKQVKKLPDIDTFRVGKVIAAG